LYTNLFYAESIMICPSYFDGNQGEQQKTLLPK
jgi:hypothetical protein